MVMSPSSIKHALVLSLDFGLIGSEPSLVKIWGNNELLHTLLEVCPAHKDKVEIFCWWKNTNITKTLHILL
jgi:hypothetical protein